MAKRKTLPKDFEQLVEAGNEQEIKNVFEKCDINAYGGYNKGNAFEFLISESMMRCLMEQGANINYVDTYGYTPLLYHAGHKYAEEQAIYLVKLGADIFATQGWNRETALHKAVYAGSLNLVKCLLEAGANATATDANGDTPLEHAFRCARTFDLVKLEPIAVYLLEEGVPVTERLQNYMQKVAEDIEFRRKDLNPEYIDELDHAMNHLYELLHVEPVPKRILYDGKTRIEIHAKAGRSSMQNYGICWYPVRDMQGLYRERLFVFRVNWHMSCWIMEALIGMRIIIIWQKHCTGMSVWVRHYRQMNRRNFVS